MTTLFGGLLTRGVRQPRSNLFGVPQEVVLKCHGVSPSVPTSKGTQTGGGMEELPGLDVSVSFVVDDTQVFSPGRIDGLGKGVLGAMATPAGIVSADTEHTALVKFGRKQGPFRDKAFAQLSIQAYRTRIFERAGLISSVALLATASCVHPCSAPAPLDPHPSSAASKSPRQPKAIQAAVRARYDCLRICYEEALWRTGAEGRIIVRFVIGESGAMKSVSVEPQTFRDPEAIRCMRDVFLAIHFGPGKQTSVLYPLMFTAAY